MVGREWRWRDLQGVFAFKFTCGYCDAIVAPDTGWDAETNGTEVGAIRICPNCRYPSFFDLVETPAVQVPAATPGAAVNHLPNDIEKLYFEARVALGAGAPTAAVLACRKILMHVSVQRGAGKGLTFVQYVEFLRDQHYIPPGSEGWVDHIREKGNEANHEIVLMGPNDAGDLLALTEMLLKLVYDFPKRTPAKGKK